MYFGKATCSVLLIMALQTNPELMAPFFNNYSKLTEIINKLNGSTTLLIYENPTSVVNVVSEVLSKTPVEISNADYIRPEWDYLMFQMGCGKAETVVVILEDPEDIADLRMQALWDEQAKLVVIIENEMLTESIFQEFWKHHESLNVLVVLVSEDQVRLFITYPYANSRIFEIEEEDDWFPEKIPMDFERRRLQVGTVVKEPYIMPPKIPLMYEEGVEVRLLKSIAEIHNFHLTYKHAPKGENPYVVYKNNERIGLLGLLYRHEADIACFGVGLGNDRYYAAEALNPHTQDTIVWMVPAPGPKSNWDSIYVGFSPQIWASVFGFLIAIAVTLRAVGSKTKDSNLYPTLSKCFLESWSATLNLGMISEPKSNNMRVLTFFILIYAIIISSAYQSFLITLLTSKRWSKAYAKIEEVVDAGLTAYLFPSSTYMQNQTKHAMWNKLLSNYISETNYTLMLGRITGRKDAFAMMIRSAAEYVVRTKFPSFSGPKAIHLSPYFSNYPITCYMSPGHPLKMVFNRHIDGLVEGGIPDIWAKQILERSVNEELMAGDVGNGEKPLSLQHLAVTFLILGVGLIVSTSVFLVERIYNVVEGKGLSKKDNRE